MAYVVHHGILWLQKDRSPRSHMSEKAAVAIVFIGSSHARVSGPRSIFQVGKLEILLAASLWVEIVSYSQ